MTAITQNVTRKNLPDEIPENVRVAYRRHLDLLKILYTVARDNPNAYNNPERLHSFLQSKFSSYSEFHEMLTKLDDAGAVKIHDQIWNPDNIRVPGHIEARINLVKFREYISRVTPTRIDYLKETTLDDFMKK